MRDDKAVEATGGGAGPPHPAEPAGNPRRTARRSLNQSRKFFHGNARAPDQGAERSSVELSMVGHRQMTTVWVIEDNVASLLTVENKPYFSNASTASRAGDDR